MRTNLSYNFALKKNVRKIGFKTKFYFDPTSLNCIFFIVINVLRVLCLEKLQQEYRTSLSSFPEKKEGLLVSYFVSR